MKDISNSIIYLISIIGELKSVCQEYYDRICQVESSKYDLEKEVEYKDYMVWIWKNEIDFKMQIGKNCHIVLFYIFLKSFFFLQIDELNIAVNDLRGKL